VTAPATNAPMYSVMLTDAYAFGSGGTGLMVDVHVLMFGGTATSDFKMEVCPGGESMEISWAWPKCLIDEDFKSNIGKSSDSCIVAFKRGLKTFLEKHPNGMFSTTVSLAPHKVLFPQPFDIRMVKFLDDEDSTQGQVAIVKLIIKNEESTIERTAEVYSAPKKRKSFTTVAATAAGTDGRNRSSDRGGDTSDN
jgi:hypothetical protein